MLRHVFVAFTIAAAAAAVAGCNGGQASPPPFFTGVMATPSPTPTPGPQHLYVGNDNASGEVFQYTLPITALSTSNFTLTSPSVVAMALDANGNLGTAQLTGPLRIFAAPLSGASTASATFANGAAPNTLGMAFVPSGANAGDLWAGSSASQVYRFTPPFTNASTPATTLTTPGTTTEGVAFDPALNMYVTNAPGGALSNVIVYAPPYTGAPVVTAGVAGSYRKDIVSATQLFVAAPIALPGRIDVYTLPITAASVPAFAITTGVSTPEAVALDSAGNLYVGNLGNHTVTVYAPPFSAASAPTVTLTVGGAGFAIFAIAIGK
jgi:hypothetical protein